MKARLPSFPGLLQLALIVVASLAWALGCSGGGDGGLNLDARQGATQERILTIEPQGDIALVALELPFNNQDLLFENVSLVEEGKPERTQMEKSFSNETGKLKVGLVSGQEKGFDGRKISLRLQYSLLDGRSSSRVPFDESMIVILSALDARFADQRGNKERIALRWEE